MPGEKLMIGQGKGCQLRPTGDDIEAEHCMIFTREGQLLIQDLKSRTGTFVNGTKVPGQQELKTGDRVRVGRSEFDVQISVDVGGKKNDDLDISQWLTETDHTPTMIDTKHLQTKSGSETPGTPAMGHSGKKAATLFDRGDGVKLTTGSSKEAAAEILKQMFAPKQAFGKKPRP